MIDAVLDEGAQNARAHSQPFMAQLREAVGVA